MNNIPFREHHFLTLLESYSEQTLPPDIFISDYFRSHKALGSKDRAFIAETMYAMIRWQGLIDHLSPSSSWSDRYHTWLNLDIEALQKNEEIPLHIRVSFPSFLFDLFVKEFGEEKAKAFALTCNTPAPTTVRANTLKISRDELIKQWEPLFSVSRTEHAPNGIIFHKKTNFFQLPQFQKGFFEIQDEGSQLISSLVKAKPGDLVLDYCAGSGGKALALAPPMEGKGQIYLHDIRPYALQEARKRLRRAGVQNQQILLPDSSHLSKLKKKMDWVLVDAPCSGTGTLRRNPDSKWKIDRAMIDRLVGQQRMIFEKALSFLHPEGRIVYATCSVLQEENQRQMEHFLSTYSLQVEGDIFQTIPTPGEMDGFFGVVFKKSSNV